MVYCKKCGAQIRDELRYCTTCGCRLETATTKIVKKAETSTRSRLVAGLLGIFAGGFGVHNFYLGRIAIGILQVAVTLLTFGVGSVWGLVEGVLILCGRMDNDSKGRTLLP
jgi:TM2 domain-containing membrane protein YozV